MIPTMSTNIVRSPTLPAYAKNEDRPYDGDPWARQPRESAKSYHAFRIFLDMGDDRSRPEALRRYATETGVKSAGNSWPKKHRWEERALAFDNYMTSIEVATHKKQRIRAATRHAKQAAEIQEVLMLPMQKLRERLRDALSGDESALTMFDTMEDDQLAKVARSFTSDLPTWQKAERDALSSTSDTVVPRAELKAKGEIVRQILAADPSVRALMEAVTFSVEVSETVDPEPT